jgi:hypothetical protein
MNKSGSLTKSDRILLLCGDSLYSIFNLFRKIGNYVYLNLIFVLYKYKFTILQGLVYVILFSFSNGYSLMQIFWEFVLLNLWFGENSFDFDTVLIFNILHFLIDLLGIRIFHFSSILCLLQCLY